MNKLRLLLTEDCNRGCVGCCNKDWDLSQLEVETDFTKYQEIYLTGGEPMMYPDLINSALNDIYSQNISSKVFLYTALCRDSLIPFVYMMDGITLTLHNQADVFNFQLFNSKLPDFIFETKSLRLNIFKGIEIDPHTLAGWSVKKDIEWIKDAPLPEDEVFRRYND